MKYIIGNSEEKRNINNISLGITMAKKLASVGIKIFDDEIRFTEPEVTAPAKKERKQKTVVVDKSWDIAEEPAESLITPHSESIKIIAPTEVVVFPKKKTAIQTAQPPSNEFISAEDGLDRISQFVSNIETMQKYIVMMETDMIGRRVRNLLMAFSWSAERVTTSAKFENELHKTLLKEQIAIAAPLIVKWDNLPDISDMTMNKIRKEK